MRWAGVMGAGNARATRPGEESENFNMSEVEIYDMCIYGRYTVKASVMNRRGVSGVPKFNTEPVLMRSDITSGNLHLL